MNAAAIAPYAEEMIRLADSASLAPPLTDRDPDFELADAYRVSAEVVRRREAQGWRRIGRKIGFTNRSILQQYGVFEPIFGYIYDRTVVEASASGEANLSLDGLVQPLFEPEIALKLRTAPPATKDPIELLGCIEWIAHGIEIVHCHFPNWKFKAADTVADGGLHGRYIVGPPLRPEPAQLEALAHQLETFEIVSFKNGVQTAEGGGDFVLGSPINALAHLIEVLQKLREHPVLVAGELITTGTLTATLPIASGETWSTKIAGLPVTNLQVQFT